jgi:hypothetical protein
MSDYDSTIETQKHIEKVASLLWMVRNNLSKRGMMHDVSKLVDPEKAGWDEATPNLKNLEYGSDEYRAELRRIRPIIDHHYAHNSHHPEFYENGMDGMSLLDVIEMLCDWKAASKRGKQTTTFRDSMMYNKDRWKISDQLFNILDHTCEELGFYDD